MSIAEQKQSAAAKNERVDLRLNSDLKQTLEMAAALVGQTLSSFILSVMVPRHREVIRDANSLSLSARDRDRFLAALDENAEPNQALTQAAEQYKAALSRGQ